MPNMILPGVGIIDPRALLAAIAAEIGTATDHKAARAVAVRHMAEAKARGYDTKVMKKVIALRKRDRDDIAEEEAILDMYKAALGMV